MQRRQAGGVTFHRRHDPLGAHAGLVGAQLAGLPVLHRALLIELDAQCAGAASQAADQLGRLDGGAVRTVDRAEGVGHADAFAEVEGGKPAVVGLIQAQGTQGGELGLEAVQLFGVTRGAVEHPALAVVALDTFALQHLGHLVGNAMQQVEGFAPGAVVQTGEQAVFAEQVAHQPAAVAPGGAKARDLRFQNGDAQLRGLALEVVGGPQPGVAGADDRHVDLQVLLQGRAGRQGFVELIHPQTDVAPGVHAGAPSKWDGDSLVVGLRAVVRACPQGKLAQVGARRLPAVPAKAAVEARQ